VIYSQKHTADYWFSLIDLNAVYLKMNGLYEQFTEICTIGKVLYKQTDKAKLNDYTFAWLMKQVRRADKPAEEKPAEPNMKEA
jgi:hypothetical protein